jgi:succinate dehydrogenase flavin-adding protein (antitoxin of CptAB toxin-antitoxin module)
MKELDVILERYVRSHLAAASAAERQVLTDLLELPDPILADYLLGPAVASDPPVARMIAAIRDFIPTPLEGTSAQCR